VDLVKVIFLKVRRSEREDEIERTDMPEKDDEKGD
jgi:hypothetical protein